MKARLATLGEVAEFINGAAFKPSDWGDVGKKIIRIQNLTDSSKPYNKTTRSVNKKLNINYGDILVSWSATLGVFVWTEKDEAVLNQHIFKVIHNSKIIDKNYLRHCLHQALDAMAKHLHGATMKHVNRGEFLATQIPLPPLAEQQRIAALLDTADRILKQRESAIAKMENLIRSYFYEIVLKNSTTDQLFELGSVVELKYGKSLPSQNRRDGEFNVYGSNGVVGSHIESITSGETIIVGRKGSFGEINLSLDCCFPIDTTYYIDKSATKQNIVWLRYALETLKLNTLNKSAAVPGLNREDAYRQKIQLINRNLQNDFEVRIRKIWSLIKTQNDFIHKHKRLIASLQHQSFAVN